MHHPGCWVTNNGCSSAQEHRSFPIAQAYGADQPPIPRPTPLSGEGTRVSPGAQPMASQVKPQRGVDTPTSTSFDSRDQEESEAADGEAPVIGDDDPLGLPPRTRRQPQFQQIPKPKAPRRYEDGDGGRNGGPKPLPKIYGGRRPVDFWYIPAAIIVAAIVAVAVILGVDKFTGNDSNKAATSPTTTGTVAATGTPSVTASPTAATTAAGAGTAVAVASTGPVGGPFTVGEKLVVANTGDCLNVRTQPSTLQDAVVCLKDGSPVTVTGGPQTAGQYTWWKVSSESGEGWAVADYLAPTQ